MLVNKKSIAIALALASISGLTACGKSSSSTGAAGVGGPGSNQWGPVSGVNSNGCPNGGYNPTGPIPFASNQIQVNSSGIVMQPTQVGGGYSGGTSLGSTGQDGSLNLWLSTSNPYPVGMTMASGSGYLQLNGAGQALVQAAANPIYNSGYYYQGYAPSTVTGCVTAVEFSVTDYHVAGAADQLFGTVYVLVNNQTSINVLLTPIYGHGYNQITPPVMFGGSFSGHL